MWRDGPSGVDTQVRQSATSAWKEAGVADFAPVAAAHSRSEEGAMTLLGVGMGGRVLNTYWPAMQTPRREGHLGTLPGAVSAFWAGWEPIDEARFPSRSPVTALRPRSEEGAVSAFAIADDGRIWTTYWPVSPNDQHWAAWYPIGDKVFRTPDSTP